MLEQDVRDFIEQNIDYLDEGVEVFLKQAHSKITRNTFMYKLCRALEDAGIDTAFRREDYYRRCMKDIHGGTNI